MFADTASQPTADAERLRFVALCNYLRMLNVPCRAVLPRRFRCSGRAALRSGRLALDELRARRCKRRHRPGQRRNRPRCRRFPYHFRNGRSANLRCSQRTSPGKPADGPGHATTAVATAAAAKTLLQITCPRRSPGAAAVTAKTHKFGLEITAGLCALSQPTSVTQRHATSWLHTPITLDPVLTRLASSGHAENRASYASTPGTAGRYP
jgi:hypothetical protein